MKVSVVLMMIVMLSLMVCSTVMVSGEKNKKGASKHQIDSGCRLLKEKKKHSSDVARSYNDNLILIQGLETVIASGTGNYPAEYQKHLDSLKATNAELALVQVSLAVHIEALEVLCIQKNETKTESATPTTTTN